MEILELLWPLAEGTCCVLEFFAVTSNAGTAATAVKATKHRRARREAVKEGREPPPRSSATWLVWVFLAAGVFFTGLVVFKYLGRRA
jgi:hypothetical protein